LFEPGTILNASGKPFQVFSAFWRVCLAAMSPTEPTPAPARIPGPKSLPESLALADFELEPEIDWAEGMREMWKPGESGAVKQIESFLETAIATYATGRDRPDHSGTSRLSPHLHFGEASVRQVWHRAGEHSDNDATAGYLRQIGWREFSHHLMFHFPHTPQHPLHQEFRFFPWRFDADAFRAWTRGQTGYPLVDAGMRELWHTGWMHNRVRMLVASFLVKHLMISWEEGARWFWDTLVDADLANNTMGWQWTSGCGADAAPYFRIFNPVAQGEKFDPEGAYVRRWVPELSKLSKLWIHKPWKAPAAVLSNAKVQLGRDYPWPIVDHGVARARALAALAAMKAR
jgi:deoxyribodipyrimidine photo-lyase